MPYSLALCFKTREGQFRFAACGCSSFSTSAAVNNVLLCCADVLCLLLCAILFHLLAKTEFVLAVFYSNDCGLGSLWTHVVVVVVAQTLVHWSHQSCFSDPTFCSGLGLIGSKGSFMPALICQRGLWYVNLSVLAVSLFAVSYLNKCLHIIFCYLVSRPLVGSLGSVRCVGVCFGCLPVGVGSITTYSWI
jgi:hypothetical protein